MLSSPSKALGIRVDTKGRLTCRIVRKGSAVLSRSGVNLILRGKAVMNGAPHVAKREEEGVGSGVRSPFCHFGRFITANGRLSLGLGNKFKVVFHTCGRKITCQFCAARSSSVVVGRRRTRFGFGRSCATCLPCAAGSGGPVIVTCRGMCSVAPLSGTRPGLTFLPIAISYNDMGLALLRSSLRTCPNVFIRSRRKGCKLGNIFTPCPTGASFCP